MRSKEGIIKFNDFVRNRKSRLFISLLAIGHGIIIISEGATFTSVSFGSDILFSTLLMVLGVLLGITSVAFLRYKLFGRIITALLASLYAVLCVAMFDKNLNSAYTAFMIVVFLSIEEVFIYER